LATLRDADTLPNFRLNAGQVDKALRWSARSLVAIVWICSGIFAAFILALYIGGAVAGTYQDWNDGFPGLYARRSLFANIGIGLHFGFGAVLLLLGPIQLIARVRQRHPVLHRWTGRVCATAAFVTGIGGLVYIVFRGTVGGPGMSAGFALYGALMAVAAEETVRHAMARRLAQHRAWAIRLFALAIGSWLYRMDYGFWRLLAGGVGHTKRFDGWFDMIMVFWFYLPNLAVAEFFIQGRQRNASASIKIVATLVLSTVAACLLLATTMITFLGWGPAILWRLGLLEG
jgi:hypothetical protein